MVKSPVKSEKFAGSAPSNSPTTQESGVFSSCSGGVPVRGAFGRLPGKVLKFFAGMGGVISIAEFGKKLVVQYFSGVVVFDASEIEPDLDCAVTDNSGNLVYDNFGNIVTQCQ